MQNNRIRLKGGSINKYQRLINTHIINELGDIKISELSSLVINSFLEQKLRNGRVDGKGGLSASYKTQLVIDTPKTKASKRVIPIPSVLLPLLINLHKTSISDCVISETTTFVSPRTYEYRYHKILKECKIEAINYHALRHTFATRCIEAGVDVKSLSEILGHANVSVTLNTYVHSSIELKRVQLEKVTSLSA